MIEGIDFSSNEIEEATRHARNLNFDKIKYFTADFLEYDFKPESYDLILFNSSLHHFNDMDHIIQKKVLPLLKTNGLLVIFEYIGPNRLQWTKFQLDYTNKLLKELPYKFKLRAGSCVFRT